MIIRPTSAWLLALLLSAYSIAGQAAEPVTNSHDFKGITDSLKQAVEDTPLDGACLLVVKDDQTICEECFGEYTPETVVPIASASKWLSAATMMTLVDEGKLSLDDPVSKYLPEFTGKKGEITIRQLLSHTSGLPGDDPAIGTFRITLREAADQISELPLVADPGKEFRYGGVSMQVAGAIAEIVSGKTWADLFQEKIAGPCEMKNTSYGRFGLNRNPRIAGGASSTMNDYRNFLTMILAEGEFKGRRVLSKDAIREMEKDQTRGAEQKSATLARLTAGSKYGLGEWLDRKDDNDQGIEISSPGAFGFRPWIDRENNLLGVFVVEIRDRRTKRSLARLADIQGRVRTVVARNGEESHVLFDFAKPESANEWTTVNDGVMGGVSEGKFKVTDQKTLEFFGTLSLENNGGFASVRTKPKKLGLEKGDILVARIRGDGRTYSVNLYVPSRLVAFSYRATIETKKDQWIEIRLPLDQFEATRFGRTVRDAEPVNPAEVDALGFLLGDKKAGPFKLEVEWIKVVKAGK